MILVTCANGKLGDRIIRNLLHYDNVPAIRAGARSLNKIDKMLASRCTLITVDYDKPATLSTAFKRVTTLIFISGNADNATRIAQHRNVIEAAKAAGVKRIIYTSFSNPVTDSGFNLVQAHIETEKMLADSGIPHTVLRNGMYASNLDGFVDGALQSGMLAMPAAAHKICYSTHDDLAAATAKVAMEAGHDGKTYELTGAEPLDADDLARLLSELSGRQIGSADIPLDDFRTFLGTLGMDAATAADLASIFGAAAADEYATPHDDLAQLLGRTPSTTRDHLSALISAKG